MTANEFDDLALRIDACLDVSELIDILDLDLYELCYALRDDIEENEEALRRATG